MLVGSYTSYGVDLLEIKISLQKMNMRMARQCGRLKRKQTNNLFLNLFPGMHMWDRTMEDELNFLEPYIPKVG